MEETIRRKMSNCIHSIKFYFDDIYNKIEITTDFHKKGIPDRFIKFEFEPNGEIRIFKMNYDHNDSQLEICPGDSIRIF